MNTSRWLSGCLCLATMSAMVVGCAGPMPWHTAQTRLSPPKPDWNSPYNSAPISPSMADGPVTAQIRGQNAGPGFGQGGQYSTNPGGYSRNPMPASGTPASYPSTGDGAPRTTYQPARTFQPPPPAGGSFGPGGTEGTSSDLYQLPQTNGGNGAPPPGYVPFGSPEVVPGPGVIGPRPGAELGLPPNFADVDAFVEEARTGRFMFGVGVNSNAGVTGQIVLDERNFDIRRVPTSFQDFVNGTAFRGAGQGFRIEALPGSQVQRYMVSFTEPYLLDTQISMSLSGFLFTRSYFDWNEERLGGRISLGYRLTHDLSLSASMRMENVNLNSPRVTNVPELNRAVGDNEVYAPQITLTHDTRDMPFAPTEGHYIELSASHAFGTFDYSRADIDVRQYHLILERPDGSGRHTLSYGVRAGFSGSQTPIYDNYFAGGFSTLRGFNFRGASPVSGGVVIGGPFRFLGSVEYLFPVTADDMIKAVAFCDFGTVEDDVRFDADTFRVAPGFGLRVNVPAMGPAPLAFDFAFPINSAVTDQEQMFSFFIGFGRL